MDADSVKKYIGKRYQNWLDYAIYQCSKTNMDDEAFDVLNEVIMDLMQKDQNKLQQMCSDPSKCGKYKMLDIYVLRMIKLNVFSSTSPYQNRYKSLPIDTEVEFSKLSDIEANSDPEEDKPTRILEQMNQVREVFETLDITMKAREIFEYRFFHGLPLSTWSGPENKKELYEIYLKVVQLIRKKLNGELFF